MDYKNWAEREWEKCRKKITKTAERIQGNIPYSTKDGKYGFVSSVDCWTNSFWAGILWLMYTETKDENFKKWAEQVENTLAKNFDDAEKLHHDVGFMWLLSSVNNYKITGNLKSKSHALIAAHMLAGRYNIKGGYIRAWNTFPEHPEDDNKGWAIIDCMMNIPLLYWASEITDDERFKYIAMSHADKVIDNFIRADGSVSHIVKFNPTNGEFIKSIAGQGYADDSSWSRGQSWAINGFSQSYIATGEKRYLDAAKRVANYFIAACVDDALPRCDFRQPSDVVAYDSSAAAIASVGLINISNACEGAEKEMYLSAALRFLKTLDERCCPWENENDEAILNYGMERFNSGHRALIYGDYYFLEAILKLKNM